MRTPRCATCLIRSVGSWTRLPDLLRGRVVDVERVRPGLHEPGRRHRRGRHRRAEPRHPDAVGQLDQGLAQSGATIRPASEHLVAGQGGQLVGTHVDEPVRVRDRAEHDLVPRGLVRLRPVRVRGQDGHLVGPQQVRHRGRDRPARRGGGRLPAVLAEPVDGRAELVALGCEVVEQAGQQVAHACCLRQGAVEDRGPLVEDPATPARVVGDGAGEAEPADQVEGGLHQLAHTGLRLVGAEQLDGEPVRLPPDPLLERGDGGEQASRRCAPRPTARARR